MTIEPEVLRRSAEVMGFWVFKIEDGETWIYRAERSPVERWQPDLYGSQLVDCIIELMKRDQSTTTLADLISSLASYLEFEDMDWKEAIVRAVAAIGEKK